MITLREIRDLAAQYQIGEDMVEKDYVIGWVLWGFGSDPEVEDSWIFKGGTCLKKCYLETFRFSEDLDFTLLPEAGMDQPTLMETLGRVLSRVQESSGIDFSQRTPIIKLHPTFRSAEGRLYYRGPRGTAEVNTIRLDLNGEERVIKPSVLRPIAHAYSDPLPSPGTVRCYSFDEVFAEKIRAMGERSRPRDLYDIIHLFRRPDVREHGPKIHALLTEKCQAKGVSIPTYSAIDQSPLKAELVNEWANMLAHQLPVLPTFEQFWEELPHLFDWLNGTLKEVVLPAAPLKPGEMTWTPPALEWIPGGGARLDPIRFAASNRLCVQLVYTKESGERGVYLVEPYSLRTTKEGNRLLYARKHVEQEDRSFRLDRIRSIEVTNNPFTPMYQIEFTASGPLAAPLASRGGRVTLGDRGMGRSSRTSRSPSTRMSQGSSGMKYVIQCSACGRRFTRSSSDGRLNPHKSRQGWECRGTGYVVDQKWV